MPPEIEAGVYQIDIGSNDDFRYIGWGWHWQESIFDMSMRWTGEYPTAEVYVDLLPGAYELSIAAQAFWEERQLSILVDGRSVGDPVTVATDALNTFTFEVPTERIGDGEHTAIALEFDDVIVPSQVEQSADERRLAIMVDWMRFTRQAEATN
jgi:hypothetical protein